MLFKRLMSFDCHFISMDSVKYFTVSFPRKKAIVAFIPQTKIVTAIHCTNSVFCNRFRLSIDECPQYCEVIAEVKKFVLRGRQPRAVICELDREDIDREAVDIEEMMPLQIEVVS